MGDLLNTLVGLVASHLGKNRKLKPGSTDVAPVDAAPDRNATDVADPTAEIEIPDASEPAGSEPEQEVSEAAEYKPPEAEKPEEELEPEPEEDPYDAAVKEAVAKEDEAKQDYAQEKAEQDKEFFGEKAEQEQDFWKEKADQEKEFFDQKDEQAEQQEKVEQEHEFWDDKKGEEIQADEEKQLRSLEAVAEQEHERDELDEPEAEKIEKKMEQVAGEHTGQLEENGLSPDEVPKPFGPYGVGPKGGFGLNELVNPNNDFGPWEKVSPSEGGGEGGEGGPKAGKDKFFKNIDDTSGPSWLDEPPKDTSEDIFWSNPDRMRTATGKDIPDGWMQPAKSDSELAQERDMKVRAEWAAQDGPLPSAPEGGTNQERVEAYSDKVQRQGWAGSEEMTAEFGQKLKNVDLEAQLTGLDATEVAKYKSDLHTDPLAKGTFEKGFEKPYMDPAPLEPQSNEKLLKDYGDKLYEAGYTGSEISEKLGTYRQQLGKADLVDQLVGADPIEMAKYKNDLMTDPNAQAKFEKGFANPAEQPPQPSNPEATAAAGGEGPKPGNEGPKPDPNDTGFDHSKFVQKGPDDSKFTTPAMNANLVSDYEKLLQERGASPQEVKAGTDQMNQQVQQVEQENKPQAPAPASPSAPEAAPATPQQQQPQAPAPSLSSSFNSVA